MVAQRLLGVGGEPGIDNAERGFMMLSAVVVRWELCPERGVCREKDKMVGIVVRARTRGLGEYKSQVFQVRSDLVRCSSTCIFCLA